MIGKIQPILVVEKSLHSGCAAGRIFLSFAPNLVQNCSLRQALSELPGTLRSPGICGGSVRQNNAVSTGTNPLTATSS
jgi:hypothetical protein